MALRDIEFRIVLIGCEEQSYTGFVGYKLHRIWSAIWLRLNRLYKDRVKIGPERFSCDKYRRQLNVQVKAVDVDFDNMTEREFKSQLLDELPLKERVQHGIIRQICVEHLN